jgi:predicted RNase H-like HicB family nuclease
VIKVEGLQGWGSGERWKHIDGWSILNQTRMRGKPMELSAVLTPAPEGGYVAFNPETGTTTQGETVEEALANLREATELFLEEFPQQLQYRKASA